MNDISNFIIKFVFLTIIAVIITVAFAIMLLLMMKVKKADYYRVIKLRQALIVFIASVYFWGIGGIAIGTILWMIFFLLFRKYFFVVDARRIEELYMQYERKGREYPLVKKFDEVKNVFFVPSVKEITNSEGKYSFTRHLDSLTVLLFLCFFDITTIATVPMIYIIEFLIVATAGYILLSKLVYYLEFTTPSSIFFLSPKLSYIPVILLGVLYYLVAIIMLLTILGIL